MLYKICEDTTTLVIVSLAIIIVAGFLMSRLTKLLKLPNVTGYIIAGVLIGPHVLNIIPQEIVPSFSFITDLALAFIAFGVGRYINLGALKQNAKKTIVITLFESLLAMVLVFVCMKFIFNCSYSLSLVLASIAATTAPTSTLMTIRQYNAKGNFVDTLIQVIALDNALALIVFNICLVFAKGSEGGMNVLDVVLPLVYNLGAMGLGVGLGFLLKKLINEKYSMDSRLIMTFAIIISLTAVCVLLGVSPLLACMTLGATYVSAKGNTEMFNIISSFTPPILLIFFVYSGMNLELSALLDFGLMGIVYFLVRILGKLLGSFIGGSLSKSSLDVKKYLGLALIPQAGVSIGLAAIAQRSLPVEAGGILATVILSSAILYELIGPVFAKFAIFASGSPQTNLNPKKQLTPMEQYIKDNFKGDVFGEKIEVTKRRLKKKRWSKNKKKKVVQDD